MYNTSKIEWKTQLQFTIIIARNIYWCHSNHPLKFVCLHKKFYFIKIVRSFCKSFCRRKNIARKFFDVTRQHQNIFFLKRFNDDLVLVVNIYFETSYVNFFLFIIILQ